MEKKVIKTTYLPSCILLLVLLFATSFGQQRFIEQPGSQTEAAGRTVKLNCIIKDVVGQVQWAKGKLLLGPSRELHGFPRYTVSGTEHLGEYNLMIHNLQLEDDDSYQCQVMATAATRGMGSEIAIVTVLVPPEMPVVGGAPRVEVIAGEPYNLTCQAHNARPAATITWVSDGIELTDQTYQSITTQADGKRQDTTSKLTILPKKGDQDKRYECRALNEALVKGFQGPVWTKVHLEVLYPPEVKMQAPSSKRLREFETATFSCEASANPNDITWTWYRAGEEVPGVATNILRLEHLNRKLHGKKVSCQAKNKVGSTKQSYTLNIEYSPQFLADPRHVAVDTGDEAVLECKADGNPAPNIIWRRQNSQDILSTSTKLKFLEVREVDFDVYICTAATLGFTHEISMAVHLLKKGPPHAYGEAEQSAKFGEVGVIVCMIRSAPEPTSITWSRDGKPLNFDELDRYQVREEDVPGGKRSILEITSVQDEDYAEYNCSVKNEYGDSTMTITFSKKEVVSIAIILIGVLVGVVIIVILAVALFFYHKRRSVPSDSGSESSSDSMAKKKQISSPQQLDYGASPVDAWRQDNFDTSHYRYSAEYDELSYPPKDPRGPAPAADYRDGFGNYGYDRDPRRDYGTYPGTATNRIYDSNYGTNSIYGPPSHASDYGTYRQPPARDDFDPYGPVAAAAGSRLSTNV